MSPQGEHGGNVPGDLPEEPTERVSIYLPSSWWLLLRQLGLEAKASGNSQVVELVRRYVLEWTEEERLELIEAAAARTKGRRGYVPRED